MWINLSKQGIFLNLYSCLVFITTNLPASHTAPASAVLLNANPIHVKRMRFHPYSSIGVKAIPKVHELAPGEEYYYDDQEPSFSNSDAFLMQPDDAVSETRYSPPIDVVYPPRKRQYRGESTINVDMTVPSLPTTYEDGFMPSNHPLVNPNIYYEHHDTTENHPTSEDYYYVRKVHERHPVVAETTVTSNYKVQTTMASPLDNTQTAGNRDENRFLIHPHLVRNNFTDIEISQISNPSKNILSFEPPMMNPKKPVTDNSDVKLQAESTSHEIYNATIGHTLSAEEETFLDTDTLQGDMPDSPVHLDIKPTQEVMNSYTTSMENTVYYIANKTTTTLSPPISSNDGDNDSYVKPSVQSTKQEKLSSGAVTGIVIAVLMSVTFITSSVIYLLYKKYNGKCTSVVEGKFNSDNCGYLDDSIRSSVYLNNHIELPKENSEEMTSLDNDSFLNSLETMTIQNYWADSTKNTKV